MNKTAAVVLITTAIGNAVVYGPILPYTPAAKAMGAIVQEVDNHPQVIRCSLKPGTGFVLTAESRHVRSALKRTLNSWAKRYKVAKHGVVLDRLLPQEIVQSAYRAAAEVGACARLEMDRARFQRAAAAGRPLPTLPVGSATLHDDDADANDYEHEEKEAEPRCAVEVVRMIPAANSWNRHKVLLCVENTGESAWPRGVVLIAKRGISFASCARVFPLPRLVPGESAEVLVPVVPQILPERGYVRGLVQVAWLEKAQHFRILDHTHVYLP